jgi:hypothetical protein
MCGMTRRGRKISTGWVILVVMSALIAGCADTSTRQTVVAPSVTATTGGLHYPAIQTIALGDFMASYMTPSAHGLLLFGTPGAVGQPIGSAGQTALYYYDDASQQIASIATPTPAADGSPRGIQYVAAAGDWAAYIVADASQTNWELWALNLVTHAQQLVDSAAKEQSQYHMGGSVVLDGSNLIWSATNVIGGTPENSLRELSLATGSVTTLLTAPGPRFIFPEVLYNGALCYEQDDANGVGTIWLWVLSEAAPKAISTQPAINITMNDHFIVWDDVHSRSLTLYDRTTGQETDKWVTSCIRPAIAETVPYVVCVDFDPNTYRLAQLPSGGNLTFYDHKAASLVITVVNDRAYWLGTGENDPYANQVDYFDLSAT